MTRTTVNTRTRILRSARRLFNEQGSRGTTTNHIAAAIDISPGNLYYHFPNKEAIIREIHSAMIDRSRRFWEHGRQRPATPGTLEETLYLLQFFVWEYRFFRLEQNVLFAVDQELHRQHIVYHAERVGYLADFFDRLETAGVLIPLSPGVRVALMRSFWMIADYWISSLHAEGRALNRKNVRDGSLFLQTLFEPYLQKSANLRQPNRTKTKTKKKSRKVPESSPGR